MQKKHLTKYSIRLIKALQSVGIEGTFLNFMKTIYEKPMVNIILKKEKLKSIP